MDALKWFELLVAEEAFSITPVEKISKADRIREAKIGAFVAIDVAIKQGKDLEHIKAIIEGTKFYCRYIEFGVSPE